MVWSGGPVDIECVPPHDILGRDILDYLPVGKGEDVIRRIMLDSVDILDSHPINRKRIREGKNPPTASGFGVRGKGRPCRHFGINMA